MLPIKVLCKPRKYGYKECRLCNGHGSMLRGNSFYFCTKCNGAGVIKDLSIDEDKLRLKSKILTGKRSDIN